MHSSQIACDWSPVMVKRSQQEDDRAWHLDKRFPVALIVTLVVTFGSQTWVASWWASKTDSRIEYLENQIKLQVPQSTSQGDRLTRLEVKLETALDNLGEIKSILRREPSTPSKAAR